MKKVLFILFFILTGIALSTKSVSAKLNPGIVITNTEIIEPSNFTLKINTSGLVAHWKLDEGSGNMIIDSSENGNNGTIYGATWADGKFGKALDFDGYDDYVEINLTPSLTPENSITILMWVNPAFIGSEGEQPRFLQYSYQWTERLALYAQPGDYFSTRLDFSTQGVKWQGLLTSFPKLNTWYLVGLAFDGQNITLFVNGRIYRYSLSSSDTLDFSGAQYLYLGTRSSLYKGSTINFNGTIDEVRIYNRSLTEEEMNALYFQTAFYKENRLLTCSASTNEVTPISYLNGTQLIGNTLNISTLNLGSYVYTCNSTETQNYMAFSEELQFEVAFPSIDYYDFRSTKYSLPSWTVADANYVLNKSGFARWEPKGVDTFFHPFFKKVILELNTSNTQSLHNMEFGVAMGISPHKGNGLKFVSSGSGYNVYFAQYGWFYTNSTPFAFLTYIDKMPEQIGFELINSHTMKYYLQFPDKTSKKGVYSFSPVHMLPFFSRAFVRYAWGDPTPKNFIRIYYPNTLNSLEFGNYTEIESLKVNYNLKKVILGKITKDPYYILGMRDDLHDDLADYANRLSLIKQYGYNAVRIEIFIENFMPSICSLDISLLSKLRNNILTANQNSFHVIIHLNTWSFYNNWRDIIDSSTLSDCFIELWKGIANYTGDLDSSFYLMNEPIIQNITKFVELVEQTGKAIRTYSQNRVWLNIFAPLSAQDEIAQKNVTFNFSNYGYSLHPSPGREYSYDGNVNYFRYDPPYMQSKQFISWLNSSNYPVIASEVHGWTDVPWYYTPYFYPSDILEEFVNEMNWLNSIQNFGGLVPVSQGILYVNQKWLEHVMNNTLAFYILPKGIGKIFIDKNDFVTIHATNLTEYQTLVPITEDPVFEIKDFGNYSAKLRNYNVKEFSYANKLSTFIDAPNGKNVTTVFKIPSSIVSFNVNVNASQWGYSWDSSSRKLTVWAIH